MSVPEKEFSLSLIFDHQISKQTELLLSIKDDVFLIYIRQDLQIMLMTLSWHMVMLKKLKTWAKRVVSFSLLEKRISASMLFIINIHTTYLPIFSSDSVVFISSTISPSLLGTGMMPFTDYIDLFRRIIATICCIFGLPGNILTIIVCVKALCRRKMNFERKVFDLYLAEISILGKRLLFFCTSSAHLRAISTDQGNFPLC